MKILGSAINWIANLFNALQWQIENKDTFRLIGRNLLKIGGKLYPRGYCESCGSWLEWNYNGSDLLRRKFCGACCHRQSWQVPWDEVTEEEK